MARGKKKGGKKDEKEETPSTSSTAAAPTSTEAPPSTSQESMGVVEEEMEGLGLTGGGRRKKKQSTKVAASIVQPSAPPAAEAVVVAPSAPPVAAVPEKKTEPEEEELDGLGLGGGKKRNRRKKKDDKSTVAPTPTSATPSMIAPTPTGATPSLAAPTATGLAPTMSVSTPTVAARAPVPKTQSASQPRLVPMQVDVPPQDPSFPSVGGQGRGWGKGRPVMKPGATQPPTPSVSHQPPTQQVRQAHGDPASTLKPYTPAPSSSSALPPAIAKSTIEYKIPTKVLGTTVRSIPISILTNYLTMDIKPMSVYRYDVAVKPDKPKKMVPAAFYAVKAKCFPKHYVAYDQNKNCYTVAPLPNVTNGSQFSTTVEIKDPNGKVVTFEVSIQSTGIVKFSTLIDYMKTGGTSLNPPTEAIQAVDVVLRQGTLGKYVKSGRQFFKRPHNPLDLGDGLEMWTGLFQSAIFTSRPFVNVDVAHKGFPKEQNLVTALVNDFRLDPNQDIRRQRSRGTEGFLDFVKGLKVGTVLVGNTETAGQKREFICNGVVDPAVSQKFTIEVDGRQREITVADYFLREKKYKLKHPNLNCVWVGVRDKHIYFPMELLHVVYGQPRNRQLNEMQLSTMVREAATPPDIRKAKIEEVIKDINYAGNPLFQAFGLNINENFFKVPGRILAAPILQVGSSTVMPRRGQWQSDTLLKPQPLRAWGCISVEANPSDVANIISLVKSTGRKLGMDVTDPSMTKPNASLRELRNLLLDAANMNLKLVFVIISQRGRDYYHKVKQVAELEVGVITQCIKEQTASRRMNFQTMKNILLKVNAKMMGINQAIDMKSMPRCMQTAGAGGVMLVGADVTHPSPDQSSIPSIAAVSASMDSKCFIYNIEFSIQSPKTEIIVQFEELMVDHLKKYMTYNNAVPKKIFVFRDGVSEGQFAEVMRSELTAIKRAYQRMAGLQAKVEILFLLVQKRHHTRFFNEGQNSRFNVEPGTVVDTDIVHARELDYYLVSHAAIKGTARPTRYHAVCNDGGIVHEDVEHLTYCLCHLYSRCLRAVSYPTPTYYAHLACMRARSLTYGETFNNAELEKSPRRLRVHQKVVDGSLMFFV